MSDWGLIFFFGSILLICITSNFFYCDALENRISKQNVINLLKEESDSVFAALTKIARQLMTDFDFSEGASAMLTSHEVRRSSNFGFCHSTKVIIPNITSLI